MWLLKATKTFQKRNIIKSNGGYCSWKQNKSESSGIKQLMKVRFDFLKIKSKKKLLIKNIFVLFFLYDV